MHSLSAIESIFHHAAKITSADQREQFLRDSCPNPEIRHQIEQLLEIDVDAASFLASPPTQVTERTSDSGLGLKLGSRVGDYTVREKIGEGGMGVVYVAEQQSPMRRKVALKVIKPGMSTKEVIGRFEAERQALAMMEHPHIARVFDAGVTEQGYPFFAMELVRGIPITDYCDQARLGPTDRLKLFVDVCEAVQHAHLKGIIHRDIKPSNVLVTQINGKDVIKVIDFGLAKSIGDQRLTEKTVYTGFMRLLGTPSYMSPEQAQLSGLDVDTRSDIYSLGVLLYELLTGTTPLERSVLKDRSFDDIRRQIRDVEPPKPSMRVSTFQNARRTTIAERRRVRSGDLGKLLHGDLDRVIMKALHKDRELRYQSSSAFSKDICLYLNGQPVTAVGPSPFYIARKYALRHRVLIGGVTAFVVLLVTATLISWYLALQASRAEQRALQSQVWAEHDRKVAQTERNNAVLAQQKAEDSELRMRKLSYASDLNSAAAELRKGNVLRSWELLNRHRPGKETTDLRGWEWRYLWQFCQQDPHEELVAPAVGCRVTRLSVSHDDRYLAISMAEHGEHRIYVRSLKDNHLVADFPGQDATFSPVEPLLAFSRKDPDDLGHYDRGFWLWDARLRKVTGGEKLHVRHRVRGVAFSDDGQTLAVATEGAGMVLVNLADATVSKKISAELPDQGVGYPFALAGDLSIAAHGHGSLGGSVARVIELESGRELWRSAPAPSGEWIECLALSPDHKLLAVGHGLAKPTLQIWDVESGTLMDSLDEHHAYVRNVVFVKNRQLISAGADHTMRIWDLEDLANIREERVLRAHDDEVGCVAKLADGQLISGCSAGQVLRWQPSDFRKRLSPHFRFESNDLWHWRIKPDQSAMVTVSRAGMVSEWTGDQYETERELFPLGEDFFAGSVSLDASQVAAGYQDGTVRLWDIDSQESILRMETNEGPLVPDQFYADDRLVEVLPRGWRGTKFLWDLRNNTKKYTWDHTSNLISLNGKVGLSFNLDRNEIAMTDFGDGPEETLPANWRTSFAFGRVAVSPNGQFLGGIDSLKRRAVVWNLQTRNQVGDFGGFMVGPASVYFSPDNKRVAVGGVSPWSVILWDLESQQQVLTLESVGDTRRWVRFSPDGNVIEAQDEARTVYGWRAPSWEDIEAREAGQLINF